LRICIFFFCSSPIWNKVSQQDRDRLLVKKPDGQFWIDFKEATSVKYFFLIDLCHWYNDLAKSSVDYDKLPVMYKKWDGQWMKETAGGADSIGMSFDNLSLLN
jgi:hypothetical protein